jgi:hypothetical protein
MLVEEAVLVIRILVDLPVQVALVVVVMVLLEIQVGLLLETRTQVAAAAERLGTQEHLAPVALVS